ncbi:hypothetical protein GCM10009846_03210 [Agrococcus versicolor]|uniref:RNA polymerase sigma-70 region 2 domain-containing protein n=1 Tax=Agrococcus versicolor TaxID=501482 RepID=A0ABN3AK31_9MICO
MDATALMQLETRVAGGDREAFADLYDIVAPLVYGDLLPACGAERASTLTAALLVDAWELAPRLRSGRRSICAWVLAETRRIVAATAGPSTTRIDGQAATGAPGAPAATTPEPTAA